MALLQVSGCQNDIASFRKLQTNFKCQKRTNELLGAFESFWTRLGASGSTKKRVGIYGLALNPKRWTIGWLTSKAGEGWEN